MQRKRMSHKNILVLLLAVALVGCTTSNRPVGGGYYVKSVNWVSWESGGGSRELYFRKPWDRRVKVWGYVGGGVETKDDVAVFMGNTQPGKEEHSRGFFAVQGSGPLLEIEKTLLAFEAEKEKEDVSAFRYRFQILDWHLKRLPDGFELECSQHGVGQPHKFISVRWAELSTIMQRVRTSGSLQKDRSGKSYLQIQYAKPEGQKP